MAPSPAISDPTAPIPPVHVPHPGPGTRFSLSVISTPFVWVYLVFPIFFNFSYFWVWNFYHFCFLNFIRILLHTSYPRKKSGQAPNLKRYATPGQVIFVADEIRCAVCVLLPPASPERCRPSPFFANCGVTMPQTGKNKCGWNYKQNQKKGTNSNSEGFQKIKSSSFNFFPSISYIKAKTMPTIDFSEQYQGGWGGGDNGFMLFRDFVHLKTWRPFLPPSCCSSTRGSCRSWPHFLYSPRWLQLGSKDRGHFYFPSRSINITYMGIDTIIHRYSTFYSKFSDTEITKKKNNSCTGGLTAVSLSIRNIYIVLNFNTTENGKWLSFLNSHNGFQTVNHPSISIQIKAPILSSSNCNNAFQIVNYHSISILVWVSRHRGSYRTIRRDLHRKYFGRGGSYEPAKKHICLRKQT